MVYSSKSHLKKYAGQFKNGLRHGLGCLKWEDGGSYTGKFFEDQIEGDGN